jgi:hypothetical protein
VRAHQLNLGGETDHALHAWDATVTEPSANDKVAALDARIASLRDCLTEDPEGAWSRELVAALYQRYRLLGQASDMIDIELLSGMH